MGGLDVKAVILTLAILICWGLAIYVTWKKL
jgi:hypothetical protein